MTPTTFFSCILFWCHPRATSRLFRLHPCFPFFCHGTVIALVQPSRRPPDFIRFFFFYYLFLLFHLHSNCLFHVRVLHLYFVNVVSSVLPCLISGVTLNTPRLLQQFCCSAHLCCFFVRIRICCQTLVQYIKLEDLSLLGVRLPKFEGSGIQAFKTTRISYVIASQSSQDLSAVAIV